MSKINIPQAEDIAKRVYGIQKGKKYKYINDGFGLCDVTVKAIFIWKNTGALWVDCRRDDGSQVIFTKDSELVQFIGK